MSISQFMKMKPEYHFNDRVAAQSNSMVTITPIKECVHGGCTSVFISEINLSHQQQYDPRLCVDVGVEVASRCFQDHQKVKLFTSLCFCV